MGQGREAVDEQCYGPTLSGGDAPQAVRGLCAWSLLSHLQNDSDTCNYSWSTQQGRQLIWM